MSLILYASPTHAASLTRMAATGRLLALAALATAARASQFFAGAHPNVRPVGRWAHGSGNGTVDADWSSSAIEFTARGPASVHIAEAYPHGNEYAVVINGTQAFQLNTNSTKNAYPGAAHECMVMAGAPRGGRPGLGR